MSNHRAELAVRRRNLQLKAAAQRQLLSQYVGEIETRCQVVDRGFQTIQGWVRSPVLIAGGAALFLILGPRRLMSLAGKAAVLIPIARRLIRWKSSPSST